MAVRRAPGHDQLQLPAQRLASGRAGLPGGRARPLRHRHRRPQHPGRRRARLCGDRRNITKRPAIPEEQWIKLLVGARLETRDGYSLLAYPMNLEGYKRLSRLLTVGNRRGGEGRVRSHLRRSRRICRGHPGHRPAAAQDRGSRLPRAAARARPPLSAAAATSPAPCCSAATMRARLALARQSRDADEGAAWSPPTTCTITCPSGGRCTTWSPPSASAAPSRSWASAASPAPSAISSQPEEMERLFRRHPHAIERIAGDRRALPLLARSAHLPVSRPVRGRRDADAEARAPHLGGRGLALSRRRSGKGRQEPSGTNSS